MKLILFQWVQLVMNAESPMWQIQFVVRMQQTNNMLIVLLVQFVVK